MHLPPHQTAQGWRKKRTWIKGPEAAKQAGETRHTGHLQGSCPQPAVCPGAHGEGCIPVTASGMGSLEGQINVYSWGKL